MHLIVTVNKVSWWKARPTERSNVTRMMKEGGLMWERADVFHSPDRGAQPFSIGAVRCMHKSKRRNEWTEQKRERWTGSGGERERHTHTNNCIWKNISWVNTELRIEWEGEASRSGHGNRSGWWKMGGAVGSKGHWLVTSRLASRTLGTMCGRQRPNMSMTLCSLSAIRDTWETRTQELDARMSPHKVQQRQTCQAFHIITHALKLLHSCNPRTFSAFVFWT